MPDATIVSDSPLPAYHQIAQAIRYRVATGQLSAGDRLPSARTAAADWGVHYHTVRRAYTELERAGLVDIRGNAGTFVANRAREATPVEPGARRFVTTVVERARIEYGLSPEQLVKRIQEVSASSRVKPSVTVVECSELQASDYASQLEEHWLVEADPWCFDREGEPPAGPIIGTFFHYNEIRDRWPWRAEDLYFLAVTPDTAMLDTLATWRERTHGDSATLVETEAGRAHSALADLEPALQERIVTRLYASPGDALEDPACEGPLLYPPRLWAQLGPEAQRDPRTVLFRYVLEDDSSSELARDLGWVSR